ncbi:MAG TPA: OB-fold nucleic acid binding domain-containing protein [Thermosynechococcus sp. M3746_W2019_013]|uniref:hypothetical protein n=1 Tax=Thermosynechococcus sp. M3746_W2019_013 TaxID=2747806 RepID=UPI001A0D7EA0|nr:hypothetical protein [Thermosynechococcus sp. M3746_W2019_013]HIK22644.1 OB-fold nucleic acid binding domain-containing protein [Thermosynechococcus sp. M3746_W2019_013]
MVIKRLWSLSCPLFVGITEVVLPPITETCAPSATPIHNLTNFQGMTIRGTVRSVVGNPFILDNSTGQVMVDAGPRWFYQINRQPGETVTVVGKYDRYDFNAILTPSVLLAPMGRGLTSVPTVTLPLGQWSAAPVATTGMQKSAGPPYPQMGNFARHLKSGLIEGAIAPLMFSDR